MTYEVQTKFMRNVWENCWQEDGKPLTFSRKEDAETELRNHKHHMEEEGMYFKDDDYQIVQIGEHHDKPV